jgi:hypothetical protein
MGQKNMSHINDFIGFTPIKSGDLEEMRLPLRKNNAIMKPSMTFGLLTSTDLGYLPTSPGIFFVYSYCAVPDQLIRLEKLLYIGQADNICESVLNHKEFPMWLRFTLGNRDLAVVFLQMDTIDHDSFKDRFVEKLNPITQFSKPNWPPKNVKHINT